MHAYLATGVQLQGEQQPDPSEEIEVVRVPLAGVLPLLTSGEVVDVHSHTAGLHALHRLRAL